MQSTKYLESDHLGKVVCSAAVLRLFVVLWSILKIQWKHLSLITEQFTLARPEEHTGPGIRQPD